METRSHDLLCAIGTVNFSKRQFMDVNVLQQLSDYQYFYERYLTLLNELPKTKSGKNHVAVAELRKEFIFIWTH